MKRQITKRLQTEYTCYASCEENVVYFDKKPVMKIYHGFWYPNSPVCYCRIDSEGWVTEISKTEYEKRFEELKNVA